MSAFDDYQRQCEAYRDAAIKRTGERDGMSKKLDQRTGELSQCQVDRAVDDAQRRADHEQLKKKEKKKRRRAFIKGTIVGGVVVVIIDVVFRALAS